MGRNKAFLSWSGSTMLEHVSEAVAAAAGSVTLVGDPDVYRHLGYPVIPDRFLESGPLAGLEAALSATSAEWNLIAACDMPGLRASLLLQLRDSAGSSRVVCAAGRDGRVHPLCAAWHRSCLAPIQAALRRGERRVLTVLETLSVQFVECDHLENVNTPLEWSRFLESQPA